MLGSLTLGGHTSGGCNALTRFKLASDSLLALELKQLPALEVVGLQCPYLTKLRLVDCDHISPESITALGDAPSAAQLSAALLAAPPAGPSRVSTATHPSAAPNRFQLRQLLRQPPTETGGGVPQAAPPPFVYDDDDDMSPTDLWMKRLVAPVGGSSYTRHATAWSPEPKAPWAAAVQLQPPPPGEGGVPCLEQLALECCDSLRRCVAGGCLGGSAASPAAPREHWGVQHAAPCSAMQQHAVSLLCLTMPCDC